MNSRSFYIFCQKRNNNEGKANKEIALSTMWEYLWEQSKLPTEEEISAYLDWQIQEEETYAVRDAYEWLQEILSCTIHKDGDICHVPVKNKDCSNFTI